MKIFVLLFQLVFFNQLMAQVIEKEMRICQDSSEHLLILNGNIFYPKIKKENQTQAEVTFCVDCKHIYNLEGLSLSENQIIALELKPKHYLKEASLYEYRYLNSDSKNCVEFIDLYIELSIPIIINGIELIEQEKSIKLKEIKPEQLVSIIRKKTFCNDQIQITTNK